MRTLSLMLLLAACKTKDDTNPDVDCSTYGLEIPSVRGEVSGAWDPTKDRMVFFGGNDEVPVNCANGATNFRDDTWEYNRTCKAFKEIATSDGPNRRGRNNATSDGEKLYVGYGRFRNGNEGNYMLRRDVWAFDYATDTWTELASGNGPSARSNSAWVHLDGKLWMFGGNTSNNGLNFTPQADLWAFDLTSNTWEEITFTGGPRSRLFHSMATDGTMIYVYGGGDENAFLGPFLDDLWAFDPQSGEWTEMLHDGNPGPAVPEDRFWANLEYDSTDDSLVLFGGHDNTSLGNTNQVYRYSLPEGRWWREQEGDTPDQPSAGFCDFPADFVAVDASSPERRNAGASAMTHDDQMLIFGGKTDCGLINDVWSYSITAGAWAELSPATSGQACLRANQQCSSLCF